MRPPGKALIIPVLLMVTAVAAVAGGLLAWRALSTSTDRGPPVAGMLWPQFRPIAPFNLTDQERRPFDLTRLRGHWTLLFFGYTHCPDVCPATLSVMRAVARLLAEDADAGRDVQFVFVSVDPERDTPERLREYLAFFDPRFVGASAPAAELGRLTGPLGVLHQRSAPDARGHYLVDHTAAIFLIDPQARLVGLFGPPHEPRDLATRLARIQKAVQN